LSVAESVEFYCVGTCDFLALNHYTTFFTYESEEGDSIFADSDVGMIQDENYATAASFWLQVGKEIFVTCFMYLRLHFGVFTTLPCYPVLEK
jgi:hypothetical protein